MSMTRMTKGFLETLGRRRISSTAMEPFLSRSSFLKLVVMRMRSSLVSSFERYWVGEEEVLASDFFYFGKMKDKKK